MKTPTCSTCPFFASLQTQCRRNPPGASPAMQGGQMVFLGYFPPTRGEDWCGAHPEFDKRPGLTIVADVERS